MAIRKEILTVLSNGELHGYAISKLLGKSNGTVSTTLRRMQEQKLVASRLDARHSPNQSRRRLYRLTAAGEARLEELS
jgi:DNA-binding PadR family transcriptional regulator